LHADCHRRIQYQKVCPVHGEVTQSEIVSGYEYRPGKYVEIEAEDLEAIRTKEERALKIDTFVDPEMIDPLYLDGRMYYLMPSGESAAEPYEVMARAMAQEKRYGIGSAIMFGKQQLAMVREVNGVLHMAMLNFDEEIRPPEEMKAALPDKRPAARQVSLARTLIRNWFTTEFDFTKYDDQYRKKVARLIKAKVAGHDVVKPEEPEEEPDVVNLMEALKQSIAAESKPAPRRRKKRKSA
jgi:DNA end-binding protein Ku